MELGWRETPVNNEIKERKWMAGQSVQETVDGVVVSGEAAGLAEVERWVLSYGPAAKALEPREPAERVARRLREGATGYEREAGRNVVQR